MNGQSHLYLNAIRKKPVERTPIWIMRQAGRYLPEYRQLRDKHDFTTLCKTPELATEVTLQPIRRFGFDAAILFSDILVVPEALGQNLEFQENHGPRLYPQILDDEAVATLSLERLEETLQYVPDAIRMICSELAGSIPLIGFSGSPFTLATYMIEGSPTRNFKYIKAMLYSDPERLLNLLGLLTEAVTKYLIVQIRAGVQAVQIFDTWGGILPVHLFEPFSAVHMKRIVQSIKPFDVPVTLFSKGGIDLLRQLSDSGPDMLGVDWLTDLADAKTLVGDHVALQGNLDPTVLYGKKEIIRAEVNKVLNVFRGESGHVFNLGHGILPDIPVENVECLVEVVRTQSARSNIQPSQVGQDES